jgi:ribonuclease BN (tRNA processing enzyme)
MDLAKTEQNLAWLRDGGLVHVHADLIVGLPGETPESFLASYDQLFVLGPDEIQVGILKRLKGTPIARREAEHGLVFNPEPPYDLLASNGFPFEEMQRFKRFARYHELIVNSGHFDHGLAALLDGADSPGRSLLALSDWLWQQTHQEHGFARKRLFDLLLDYVNAHGLEQSRIISALSEDILAQGHLKGTPDRLRSTVEAASVRRKRQAIG